VRLDITNENKLQAEVIDKNCAVPTACSSLHLQEPPAVVILLDDFGEGLSIRSVKVGVNLVEKKERRQTPDAESAGDCAAEANEQNV
jgi:hypothetical protein